MGYKLEINASNKHIHLDQEDLETLFGKGYELTFKKALKQPGSDLRVLSQESEFSDLFVKIHSLNLL